MRICFASIGSLGDLYPCLALGVELKQRGHVVGVASTGAYRERVEPLGLHFHPLRPNWNPADPDLTGRHRVDKAAAALDRLIREPQFARRASEIAEQVRAQDGIGQACDAIEEAMAR